jgi:ribosomal protein S18 acetylase RimI-like enzyme
MIIRPATLHDSQAIAHVQITSYRTAYASFFPPEYFDHFTLAEETQDWQNVITNHPDELLFVAENGQGTVVGYALGKPLSDKEIPYDSELVALHVLSSHQRQGIGRQLIAAVAKGLQKQGCASIMLWTIAGNPVRLWYERLGGVHFSEKRSMIDTTEVFSVGYGWPEIEVLF